MESKKLLEKSELIYQGAEAKLFKSRIFNRDVVVKERFKKEYRHTDLDYKLSVRRIMTEVRAMMRCSKLGLRVPAVYLIDEVNRLIYMELIEGPTFKDLLYQKKEYDEECLSICEKFGHYLGILHANNNIHGDLTTSNIVIEDGEVVLIDFGLSSFSELVEDKAVDLYVLERAFLCTHPNSEKLFDRILESYAASTRNPKEVLTRLDLVRQRGRKRSMVG